MSKLILTMVILIGVFFLACVCVLIQNFVIWLVGEKLTLFLILVLVGMFIYKVILPELKTDAENSE